MPITLGATALQSSNSIKIILYSIGKTNYRWLYKNSCNWPIDWGMELHFWLPFSQWKRESFCLLILLDYMLTKFMKKLIAYDLFHVTWTDVNNLHILQQCKYNDIQNFIISFYFTKRYVLIFKIICMYFTQCIQAFMLSV